MEPPDTQHGDDDGVSVTSWVSVCRIGLWKVQQKRKRLGSQQPVSTPGDITPCACVDSPRLGSLCQVRVTDVTESEATPLLRYKDSVLPIPLGDWTTLRLGDGQCNIIEACLERMRAGEKCEILLTPVGNGPDVSVPEPSDGNLPLRATVELQTFSPGKECWEMSPGEKWQWVKSHKERGGVRFRSGDVWGAADCYSQALKLLIPLCGHVIEVEKKGHDHEAEEQRDTNMTNETQQPPSANEFKTIKAELHSNLSLCQLKLNQPEWAKASAAKATQLDPGGAKAWYRLGLACQMVNELEEAKRAFRKVLELQPELPAALKALKDIANKERATNAQLGLRLSKMFS